MHSQVCFPVFYKDARVGDYVADLVVEGLVVVELKCVEVSRGAYGSVH